MTKPSAVRRFNASRIGVLPAWYRALALGAVRVSQIQLIQPFLSLLFAVPLLGERLDTVTVVFALAVIATVFVGKKMPVHQGAAA